MERSAGPAVYAGFVVDMLSACPDVELVDASGAPGADVVLCLDGRFRARRAQRTVTAVLDLGHLLERRGYGPPEWLAQNWRVASAAHRSDHLLAPSLAVADGLERYLRVRPARVSVLEAPPRPAFRRAAREQVQALRRDLRLPERYFLFVGSRRRRKNLGLLAAAWPGVSARLGARVGLVLAGPGSGSVPGALDLGYVDVERLPALIAGAVAWLSPSLYEGSPTGALEAMACGTPPLVAGTGAQPRAVGTAGLVLHPHDAGEWAAAMIAIAGDGDLRSRLSAASLATAARVRAAGPRWEALRAALGGEASAAS
jgi:glycosyltransferase involved in cell wall biosynthesis